MPLYSDYSNYYGSGSSGYSQLYSPYYSTNLYGTTSTSSTSSPYAPYSSIYNRSNYVVPPPSRSSYAASSISRYKPNLTTISESPLSPRHSNLMPLTRTQSPKIHVYSPRPTKYIAPRPILINTADIDVSSSRYKHSGSHTPRTRLEDLKPIPPIKIVEEEKIAAPTDVSTSVDTVAVVSDLNNNNKIEEENKIASPYMPGAEGEDRKNNRSTIKRDRAVVRLSTMRARRDKPPTPTETFVPKKPGEKVSWRDRFGDDLNMKQFNVAKKTPGELLLERYTVKHEDDEAPPALPTEHLLLDPLLQDTIRRLSIPDCPSFHDICEDISSDKIDDDLNAGELRRRASLIHEQEMDVIMSALEDAAANRKSTKRKSKKLRHKFTATVEVDNHNSIPENVEVKNSSPKFVANVEHMEEHHQIHKVFKLPKKKVKKEVTPGEAPVKKVKKVGSVKKTKSVDEIENKVDEKDVKIASVFEKPELEKSKSEDIFEKSLETIVKTKNTAEPKSSVQSFKIPKTPELVETKLETISVKNLKSQKSEEFKSLKTIEPVETKLEKDLKSPKFGEVKCLKTADISSLKFEEVKSTESVETKLEKDLKSPKFDEVKSSKTAEIASPKVEEVKSPKTTESVETKLDKDLKSPKFGEVKSSKTAEIAPPKKYTGGKSKDLSIFAEKTESPTKKISPKLGEEAKLKVDIGVKSKEALTSQEKLKSPVKDSPKLEKDEVFEKPKTPEKLKSQEKTVTQKLESKSPETITEANLKTAPKTPEKLKSPEKTVSPKFEESKTSESIEPKVAKVLKKTKPPPLAIKPETEEPVSVAKPKPIVKLQKSESGEDFWGQIGTRETLYMKQRKQNIQQKVVEEISEKDEIDVDEPKVKVEKKFSPKKAEKPLEVEISKAKTETEPKLKKVSPKKAEKPLEVEIFKAKTETEPKLKKSPPKTISPKKVKKSPAKVKSDTALQKSVEVTVTAVKSVELEKSETKISLLNKNVENPMHNENMNTAVPKSEPKINSGPRAKSPEIKTNKETTNNNNKNVIEHKPKTPSSSTTPPTSPPPLKTASTTTTTCTNTHTKTTTTMTLTKITEDETVKLTRHDASITTTITVSSSSVLKETGNKTANTSTTTTTSTTSTTTATPSIGSNVTTATSADTNLIKEIGGDIDKKNQSNELTNKRFVDNDILNSPRLPVAGASAPTTLVATDLLANANNLSKFATVSNLAQCLLDVDADLEDYIPSSAEETDSYDSSSDPNLTASMKKKNKQRKKKEKTEPKFDPNKKIKIDPKKKCYVKEESPLYPLVATPRPLWKREKFTFSEESESGSDETDSESEYTTSTEESGGEDDLNPASLNNKNEVNSDSSVIRMSTCSNDSGFEGGTAPPCPKKMLETSYTYAQFQKTGRFTPPATSIPRFKKYSVEDFHFLAVLGKGSFGKVLLAELRNTEFYFAVKCLKKDVVLEDDDVECTLIERKVLALGTKHPYLCHLFCTFQTESHLFFCMEYLNGGDLMFHIQESGRFPEPRARFYGAEIISGLKFLHKKGIIYRDLKLDNVLLDFDGHVRIADFGMCKLQIYLDKTADSFCGTPDYMAPEIIKAEKYNQNVDWWSFGVLLYEMLVGQSPFSGCDEDELFWSICNEIPWFPVYVTQEATSLLKGLLQKDASKRIGSQYSPAGDVCDHVFFQVIDWQMLEKRQLEPPFKPQMAHPMDTQYFDKAFTKEKVRLTPINQDILQSLDQEQFQGFSYTNPNATLD